MAKNFRQVPQDVRQRLETFALDDVVVACAKRLRPQDVGRYDRLGLRLQNGQLVVPPPFVPDASAGKYSRFNVEGKEIVRRDLPMINKEFCFYAPDWGDLLGNGLSWKSDSRRSLGCDLHISFLVQAASSDTLVPNMRTIS
jgi:hypothetical protein